MGIFSKELSPCHPIYGIRVERLTQRLNSLNYQEKAVLRIKLSGAAFSLYLWIQDLGEGEGEAGHYAVCCHSAIDCKEYEAAFNSLDEAIVFINGDVAESPLAQHTRLARPSEYPVADVPPATIISGQS